jgi:hypothetical protein
MANKKIIEIEENLSEVEDESQEENEESHNESCDDFLDSTIKGIPPPVLRPEFFGRYEMKMNYVVGNSEPQLIDFSNQITKEHLRSNPGCRSNLKKRMHPYDRVGEKKICGQYEFRENRHIRNRMGQRYLRAGSICLMYVLDDDRKTVLSNPLSVSRGVPHHVHESVFRRLAPFLETNPINRQCPDNPHFVNFNQLPIEQIPLKSFQQNAISSFVEGQAVLRCLLMVESAVSAMNNELQRLLLNYLQNVNVASIQIGGNVAELSIRECVVLATYASVLYPEYYFSEIRDTVSEQDHNMWDALVLEVRRWKRLFCVVGTGNEVTLYPGMAMPVIEEEENNSDFESISSDSQLG